MTFRTFTIAAVVMLVACSGIKPRRRISGSQLELLDANQHTLARFEARNL